LPLGLPSLRAISSRATLTTDGVLDLVAVQLDGRIIRISDKNEGQSWETAQIASFDNLSLYGGRDFYLHVIDLDNKRRQ